MHMAACNSLHHQQQRAKNMSHDKDLAVTSTIRPRAACRFVHVKRLLNASRHAMLVSMQRMDMPRAEVDEPGIQAWQNTT